MQEMEALVKEVLQYNRLQSSPQQLDKEEFSVEELVGRVIAKQKILSLSMKFSMQGEVMTASVDVFLLERALINLVRNAARFSSTEVVISWELDNDDLILAVSDDGIGVPPGKRESIFEPFTRLDPSRSRDSGGAEFKIRLPM